MGTELRQSLLSPAVRTTLDPAFLRALVARRRATVENAEEKIARLRRLELQKLFGELTETRVEQSFNEQLFAAILGYRTLFSHDAGTFNLLPKNPLRPGRADDFSLGFFGGEADVVLATAEFKSPSYRDLDKVQTSGGSKGMSPVEQAFTASAGHPTCRFVLVSNFREMRLYTIDRAPLATIDLLQVRTKDDLALLCALFDRQALIGDGKKAKPEMTAVIQDHPTTPFARLDRHYRTQWLFTPKNEIATQLHALERNFRHALSLIDRWPHFRKGEYADADDPGHPLSIAGGWLYADSKPVRDGRLRIGISRSGQLFMSASEPYDSPNLNYLSPWSVEDRAHLFGILIVEVIGALQGPIAGGELEVTVLDAKGMVWGKTGCEAAEDEILARSWPLSTTIPEEVASALAGCICEIAVQFRDEKGGVLLDLPGLSKSIRSGLPGSDAQRDDV